MRKRRAKSQSGKPVRTSRAVCYMVFTNGGVGARRLEEAWAACKRNSVELVNAWNTPYATSSGKTVVLLETRYGPVHGNNPHDHREKVKAVANNLPGTGPSQADVVSQSFVAEKARLQ